MRSASDAFWQAVQSRTRHFKCYIVIDGVGRISDDDDGTGRLLKRITWKGEGNSIDRPCYGVICSGSIDCEINSPPKDIVLDGRKVDEYLTLMLESGGSETVHMGTHYITAVTSPDDWKTAKITAFDCVSKLSEKYAPTVTFPATLEAIAADAAAQAGVSVSAMMVGGYPDVTVETAPEDKTCRDILSFIAGVGGWNCFAIENEIIQFRTPLLKSADYSGQKAEITRDLQVLGGFQRTRINPLTITRIICGTETEIFDSGEGAAASGTSATSITYQNPWITKEQFDKICARDVGLTFQPCSVTWRGNPLIEPCDAVLVEDDEGGFTNVTTASLELTYAGGLEEVISCGGKTELETLQLSQPTQTAGTGGGYISEYTGGGSSGGMAQNIVFDADNQYFTVTYTGGKIETYDYTLYTNGLIKSISKR